MQNEQRETRKQHLISKVVLRQFVSDGHLVSHDLKYGVRKRRNPAQVGWRENFVAAQRTALEGLWGRTESDAAPALQSVRDGTIFDKPAEVHALKALIALHFMRREVVKDLHDAGLERSLLTGDPR